MKKSIYGGFIECGGTFKDSGKQWSNCNVLIADYHSGGKPMKAQVVKAASSMVDTLYAIPVGSIVELSYDYYQRIIGINVVKDV